MAGVYGISTRALLAFKDALATTSHNIANVNTEGYSRQRVEFANEKPEFAGFGYLGNGVKIGDVQRLYDGFVIDQVRTGQSGYNQHQAYFDLARQVDNLLADDATALSPGLQSFFNSVQEVANDPTSVAARQVMVTEGETLVTRFQYLDQSLSDTRQRVNDQLRGVTTEINGYAEAIADLNRDISAAVARGSGHLPNDLLDQRDVLIEKLSELVSVNVVPQDDGMANVFIGTGQSLVLGANTTSLVATPLGEDPDQLDIGIQGPGAIVKITDFVNGGRMGGLLQFRDQTLDPAQNALGRIGIGLAVTFNDQHALGIDLNGNPGQDFFNVPTPLVLPAVSNTGNIQVNYDNVSDLTLDDYRLSYDGANWVLNRLSDGQTVPFTSGSGTAADPYLVNGISLDVSGASTTDSYIIRPTRAGGGDIAVALTDSREVAAGTPGTGVGDNTNALALANLQQGLTMLGGTASYEDAYTTLIADVGNRTRQADISATAQAKLLEEAQNQREEISGVNLDEEAANLLRFQQAYEAAARVISTAETMFQSLLNAVGR